MKVLVEFCVSSNKSDSADTFYFHEERKESELPKPGDIVTRLEGGIQRKYRCGDQVGDFFYNMKKQIYQYTFHCEEI